MPTVFGFLFGAAFGVAFCLCFFAGFALKSAAAAFADFVLSGERLLRFGADARVMRRLFARRAGGVWDCYDASGDLQRRLD